MVYSSSPLIKSTVVALLKKQGFSQQEAQHLIRVETECLTYKDRKLIASLSSSRATLNRDELALNCQKYKLLEYLFMLKQSEAVSVINEVIQ